MIINWYKHINNCIEKHEFILGINSSANEVNQIAIIIIKTLYARGLNQQEILDWILESTCEMESKNKLKEYYYDNVKDGGIQLFLSKHSDIVLPSEIDTKIYITDKEIEYINLLDTCKENKRFLLGLLAYFKFKKKIKNNTDYNVDCEANIYQLTFGSNDYNSGKRRSKSIKKFIRYLSDKRIAYLEIPNKYCYRQGKCRPRYILSFADMNAKAGYEFEDFDQTFIDFTNEKLTDQTKICICCGKSMLVTSKQKRDICDSCYADYIRNSKKKSMRKLRAERKNTNSGVA